VIGSGIRTAALGLMAGMLGVAALASGSRAFLFGVVPLDFSVMAGVSALLLLVALGGQLPPSSTRHAHRFDGITTTGVTRGAGSVVTPRF
jgi:hypothetical protein